MAIYNTITVAPSGSEGWGDDFLNVTQSIEYFYAPYEGSFLYANSGDFWNPYPVVSSGQGGTAVPTYNEDYQIFQNSGINRPLNSQQGITTITFPRSAQNPQITPNNSYYPYEEGVGTVLNTNVAEHIALPSVHLKMTIQPVRFNNGVPSTLAVDTTETSINNLAAESSPLYVEMIATSNAKVGNTTRASNYVESDAINNETLASDIHVYQWEQIVKSNGGSYSDYNLEHSSPNSDVLFPLGTRDIYFEAPNPAIVDNGNPALQLYTDTFASIGYTYPDIAVQISPDASSSPGTILNDLFRNKLIQSLGHLPPIYGEHFTTDGTDEFVDGGLVNFTNFGNPLNVDDIIDIYNSNYPSGFEFDNQEEEFYSKVLHAPIVSFGSPVSPEEPNTIPSRVVLNFRTNLGAEGSAPNLTQFKELNPDPDGNPNMYKTLWASYAICEVVYYDRTYRRLRLKVLSTCRHTYGQTDGVDGPDRIIFNASIDNILNTRILLDIPVPNKVGNLYFNNICQFSLMVSHLNDYSVDEKHFRQAYCVAAYWKYYYWNLNTGTTSNFSNLNSIILNPVSYPGLGGGFSFSPTSFSYNETGNANYVKDRDSFFGTDTAPFNTIDLVDYDSCLVDYTIKYNPQRFGLVYDAKNQQFILQIPRIPPCIIKGTYQVF